MEQNTEIVTRDSKAERKRMEAYVRGVAKIAKGKGSPAGGTAEKDGEAHAF